MKTRRALLSITAALFAATLGAGEQLSSPRALQEIAQVEAEIDRIEAQAIERLRHAAGQSGPANRAARQGDAV